MGLKERSKYFKCINFPTEFGITLIFNLCISNARNLGILSISALNVDSSMVPNDPPCVKRIVRTL